MVRGLLRFLAYALAIWFIYRVVIGALRHVVQDARKKPPEPPPDYHDVKDARFKDLPNDSSGDS